MLCPSCREPIDPQELSCPSGHEFRVIDGVLRLLDPVFAKRLDRFLDGFSKMSDLEGQRIHDPTPRLRSVEALAEKHRRHDVAPFVTIKVFLDRDDERPLRSLGLELCGYPQMRMKIHGLRSAFHRQWGRCRYGVWRS